MFALPNLRSHSTEPCTPWTFRAPIPEEVKSKAGKKLRDEWINRIDTEHQVYSSFEGMNPAQRITEPKGADEGNPPLRMHAFVLDIDAPVSQDELASGIGRIAHRPNYLEVTLSGNARLIWQLEKPVSFPNRKFAVEFLKFALDALKLKQVAAGVDEPAFLEPNRYYTNSCEWFTIDSDVRISNELIKGWVMQVSEKHLWKKDKGAIDIPLPVVFAEIEKKYPKHGWEGDFVETAQGPSFWLPNSTSPKSAVVKPTGLFTFSSSAIKPFYSWADILGKEFSDRHAAEQMGKAVEGIYHDGTKYWRKDGYGDFKAFSKEDIILHLTADRGLGTTKNGDESSEVSRALLFIQNWQNVNGAAPFVFRPSGLIEAAGNKFLNTHSRKVVQPSSEKTVWGPEGKMPFLSKLLDGFFHPDSVPARPLDYYLAWLSRFYKGAYELNLESGQNVFILGGVGVGKTFLNEGFIPYLMGGSENAEAYLMGTSDFNSQLFEVGYWTIDDNSASVDAATHRKFSVMSKKMAANTRFTYHAKFRVPCDVEWRGRLCVTANDDEESAKIVPNLNISIMDKISVYRAAELPPVVFPNRQGCEKIIRAEAPHFARFLLEYEPLPHCRGSSRFGVLPYHEKSLVKTAEQSSDTAGFHEMLEEWRETYFAEHKDLTYWQGTGYRFYTMLMRDDLFRHSCRSLSQQSVGAKFATLKNRGLSDLESIDTGPVREWRIPAPRKKTGPQLPTGTTYSKPTTTS